MRSSSLIRAMPATPISSSFWAAVPARVPVYEQDGFQLTAEAIQERISQKTRAMLINSPSNPTGYLLSDADMKAISGLSPYIISDEIYHGLVYEGQEHSILEFSDQGLCPERLFQALCHDRLPPGLPHRSVRVHPAHSEDAAELLHLRRLSGPEGWDCCPAGERR